MTCKKTDESFYEATGNRISNSSQLNMFDVLEDSVDGTKLLNIFKSYEINKDVSSSVLFYITHNISNDEFYDNTSYYYYKNAELWWLIPMMNNILNPFEEISPGDFLKILKPKYIYQIVKEMHSLKDL